MTSDHSEGMCALGGKAGLWMYLSVLESGSQRRRDLNMDHDRLCQRWIMSLKNMILLLVLFLVKA